MDFPVLTNFKLTGQLKSQMCLKTVFLLSMSIYLNISYHA